MDMGATVPSMPMHHAAHQRMFGSRLLSLLQTPGGQTFSDDLRAREKPNCRKHFADGLGGSLPERYGKFVSERRSLSEAWGLGHLLYKLFCQRSQRVGHDAIAEGWYPFRLLHLAVCRSQRSRMSPKLPRRRQDSRSGNQIGIGYAPY